MPKRVLSGVVVSDKGDKTVVVEVRKSFKHRKYLKALTRTVKYSAHDPENKFKVGDKVSIIECRPISKTKTWEVVQG